MKIDTVEIVPGCISCGTCEFICPEVFVVKDIAYVKKDIDLAPHTKAICEAVDMCPVSVIKIKEE